MMSYTMLCTSLCVSGGMLMRFMSPSTRIIGGTPDDRCRSEALFLTAKASSWAMSTAMEAPSGLRSRIRDRVGLAGVCSIDQPLGPQYVNRSAVLTRSAAGRARSHRPGGGGGRAGSRDRCCLLAVSKQQPAALVRAAYAAGQRDFGENYVQEGVAKVDALAAAR